MPQKVEVNFPSNYSFCFSDLKLDNILLDAEGHCKIAEYVVFFLSLVEAESTEEKIALIDLKGHCHFRLGRC